MARPLLMKVGGGGITNASTMKRPGQIVELNAALYIPVQTFWQGFSPHKKFLGVRLF